MISEKAYLNCATVLGCEVEAVKAVAYVESSGSGFQKDGKTPRILFEPHIFWKELRKRGISPEAHVKGNEDILYPKWGTKPYGPRGTYQHERLQRAANINRPAALCSASWGAFQILGQNWGLCYCKDLQAFMNKIYNEGEDGHLELFTNYIKATHLDDELRGHDWKGFARGYNGPLFYVQGYDVKMGRAYDMFKVQSKK